MSGLLHAKYSVWIGLGDELLVLVNEKQSITRAELRVAMCAFSGKKPGVKLHAVAESQLLYLGLKGKCGK